MTSSTSSSAEKVRRGQLEIYGERRERDDGEGKGEGGRDRGKER